MAEAHGNRTHLRPDPGRPTVLKTAQDTSPDSPPKLHYPPLAPDVQAVFRGFTQNRPRTSTSPAQRAGENPNPGAPLTLHPLAVARTRFIPTSRPAKLLPSPDYNLTGITGEWTIG